MEQLDFSEIQLNNPGILKTRIPISVFTELVRDVQQTVDNNPESYSEKLAGHLEHEYVYHLCDSFKQCLDQSFREYQRRFNFYQGSEFKIDASTWINLQRKHEYNPLHFHYQDVSWVIWIQIPFDLKEEQAQRHALKSNSNIASTFQFVYNKLDGGIDMHSLPVDKSFEGVLIMFPANLKHQVYPFFTSDEMRISIAGNIEVLNKP